jgi:hypothetical protein
LESISVWSDRGSKARHNLGTFGIAGLVLPARESEDARGRALLSDGVEAADEEPEAKLGSTNSK